MLLNSVLLLYAASGIWAASKFLPLWFQFAVGLLLLFFGYFTPRELSSPKLKFNLSSSAAPFLALIPVLVYFALTYHQEFPFCYDHAYHVSSLIDIASFWKFIFVPIAGISFLYVRYLRRFWFSHALFYVLLNALGSFISLPLSGIRYPALAYFFGGPWALLVQALGGGYILNASRMNSITAILAWVVVRHLLWPKTSRFVTLFFVFSFFFQKEVVFYFTSSYIEPWGISLTLLAFEALIEGAGDSTLPLVFMAAASLCKEYCFVLFPFIFISTFLTRRGSLFSWARDCALSLLPFLHYLVVRKAFNISRTMSLDLFPWRNSPDFWRQFKTEIWLQYGGSGFLLNAVLIGAVIYGLFSCLWKNRWREVGFTSSVLLPLASFSVFALFFFDHLTSTSYSGLSRFNLLPYSLLCLSAAYFFSTAVVGMSVRSGALICAIALGLNLVSLVPFLVEAAQPSYLASGGLIQMDRPLFFPIRELVARAKTKAFIGKGAVVQIELLDPTQKDGFKFSGYGYYYRELRDFKFVETDAFACTCENNPADAVLVSIFYQPKLKGKPDFEARQSAISTCVEKITRTCVKVERLLSPQGDLIGAIGTTHLVR